MLRLRLFVLACSAMALGSLWVQAQENDIKDTVRKAIEAQGGKENLLKYQAGTSKFKGTIELMGKETPITGESFYQRPDKMKNMMSLEINNQNLQIIQVFNGKTFWISVLGKTQEIKDEKIVNEVRDSLLAEGGASLVHMLEKPYELSSLGEVKVKDKDAIGVRVSKKGQRDYSLFFDKKTYLILKTEMRATDPMTAQEVTQEKFFSKYKDENGLKIPQHLSIVKDGKDFMSLDISEVKLQEKLDDATFAMP